MIRNYLRYVIPGALVICLLFLLSCVKENDQEAFRKATEIENVAQRIAALTAFVNEYPTSPDLTAAFLHLFYDHLETGNENAALNAASKYLSSIPQGDRMSHYNRVAWSLVEQDVGLDSAEVYASKAVSLARESNSPNLNMILDTYAYVLYKQGNPEKAEALQTEAVQGDEENGELLYRLALYQHDSGKSIAAIKTMARVLYVGGDSQAFTKFQQWLVEEVSDPAKRNQLTEKVINKTIADNMPTDSTPLQQSQAAVLLARTGLDLQRAEKWITQAISKVDANMPRDEKVRIYINRAIVYRTQNNFSKMLETLLMVERSAFPYDFEYWLTLGQAYEYEGEKREAVDAYINGMVWRKTDSLVAAVKNLNLNDEQIEERIEHRKHELLDFDPGSYETQNKATDRVVLVELFTGSDCSPCVGANKALEKITEYYPRSVVALLSYHVHIPRPDPLTNEFSEERYDGYAQKYGRFGVPTVYINGTDIRGGGGPEVVMKSAFNLYKDGIEKIITQKAEADLSCQSNIEGDLITIEVNISAKSSEIKQAILHIALVESWVDYSGGNGLTKHAYVVRYLANDAKGMMIEFKTRKATVKRLISITELNQQLNRYLDDFVKKPPQRHKNFSGWGGNRPDVVDSTKLAIIAWLQEPGNKHVLQAVYKSLQKKSG